MSTAPDKTHKDEQTGTQGTTVFESTREVVPVSYAGDATHTTDIDTAIEKDARTILERSIKLNEDEPGLGGEAVYRGQAGYSNFVKKDLNQVSANKITGYALVV